MARARQKSTEISYCLRNMSRFDHNYVTLTQSGMESSPSYIERLIDDEPASRPNMFTEGCSQPELTPELIYDLISQSSSRSSTPKSHTSQSFSDNWKKKRSSEFFLNQPNSRARTFGTTEFQENSERQQSRSNNIFLSVLSNDSYQYDHSGSQFESSHTDPGAEDRRSSQGTKSEHDICGMSDESHDADDELSSAKSGNSFRGGLSFSAETLLGMGVGTLSESGGRDRLGVDDSRAVVEITSQQLNLYFRKVAAGRPIQSKQLTRESAATFGFSVAMFDCLDSEPMHDLQIFIKHVIPDSIACKARLEKGDQILSINSLPLAEMFTTYVRALAILQESLSLRLVVAKMTSSREHSWFEERLMKEKLYIDLPNENELGFSIGHQEYKDCKVLTVTSIHPNGVASQDGRLKVNDEILKIGSIFLKDLTTEEVAKLLRNNSSKVINLCVLRNSSSTDEEQLDEAKSLSSPHQILSLSLKVDKRKQFARVGLSLAIYPAPGGESGSLTIIKEIEKYSQGALCLEDEIVSVNNVPLQHLSPVECGTVLKENMIPMEDGLIYLKIRRPARVYSQESGSIYDEDSSKEMSLNSPERSEVEDGSKNTFEVTKSKTNTKKIKKKSAFGFSKTTSHKFGNSTTKSSSKGLSIAETLCNNNSVNVPQGSMTLPITPNSRDCPRRSCQCFRF